MNKSRDNIWIYDDEFQNEVSHKLLNVKLDQLTFPKYELLYSIVLSLYKQLCHVPSYLQQQHMAKTFLYLH